MCCAIVTFVMADMHDHKVRISQVVSQPLSGDNQFRMSGADIRWTSGRSTGRQIEESDQQTRGDYREHGISFHVSSFIWRDVFVDE
jgi:hypothetical protein